MYLCFMKCKIKIRCPSLGLQIFPERKFSQLRFASLFIGFVFDLMQSIEFKAKILLIIIFQVCPTPCLMLNYLTTFSSRETFFLSLLATKIQNKIKIIKSAKIISITVNHKLKLRWVGIIPACKLRSNFCCF